MVFLYVNSAEARVSFRIEALSQRPPTKTSCHTETAEQTGDEVAVVDTRWLDDAIAYYLPKQAPILGTTYSLYKTVEWTKEDKSDLRTKSYQVNVEKPSSLELKSIRDEKLGFLVKTKQLKGLITETKIASINLGPNSILTGLNFEFHDKTAEIITSLVNTAVNVGKMAAMGAGVNSKTEFVKDFTINREIDLDDLAPHAQVNSITVPKVTMPDSKPWKITVLTGDDAQSEILSYIRNVDNNKDIDSVKIPRVVFGFNGNINNTYSSDLIVGKKNYYDGLIVRVPDQAEFISFVSPVNSNSSYVTLKSRCELAQTGTFARLGIKSALFSDTSKKISLSGTGAIETFGTSSTSPVERAARMLKDSTDAGLSLSGMFGGKK